MRAIESDACIRDLFTFLKCLGIIPGRWEFIELLDISKDELDSLFSLYVSTHEIKKDQDECTNTLTNIK